MKYHELEITSNRGKKRVGRGISAGQGKTAGRGTKGQKSRTGYSARPGFEGGQNPLSQRFPKLRGFRSHHTKNEVVYTGELSILGVKVDNQVLAEAGLVSSAFSKVKLLVGGDAPSKKQTVSLQAASAQAIAQIEKAGGSFTAVAQQGRPKTRPVKREKK